MVYILLNMFDSLTVLYDESNQTYCMMNRIKLIQIIGIIKAKDFVVFLRNCTNSFNTILNSFEI